MTRLAFTILSTHLLLAFSKLREQDGFLGMKGQKRRAEETCNQTVQQSINTYAKLSFMFVWVKHSLRATWLAGLANVP